MPYSHLQQTLELRFKLQGVFIVILTLCFLSTFILFSTRLRLPIRELYRISETVKESPQLEALNLQEVSRCKEVREFMRKSFVFWSTSIPWRTKYSGNSF